MAKEQSLVGVFMEHTGINFRDLGNFLEVSPTLLHLHAANTRSLPSNAMLPLALSQKIISKQLKAAPTAKRNQSKPTAAEVTFVKKEAQWCLARCRPLEKKLAIIKEKYRQGAATDLLLQTLAGLPVSQTRKRQRWIEEQRYQAQKKMETNHWMLQKKLEVAIGLLQFEANLWENT
ncbi:MAG: hypothetical protein JWP81_495 [Ferruginibacter sp.]|nr:hypothetical protein [Ferruginibacter sp.]